MKRTYIEIEQEVNEKADNELDRN